MKAICTACGCEVPAGNLRCSVCGVAVFAGAMQRSFPVTRQVRADGSGPPDFPVTRNVRAASEPRREPESAIGDDTRRFAPEHCRPLFWLAAYDDSGTPIDFRLLRAPRTEFGREAGDVLIINDPAVSSRHAQLEYRTDMSLLLSDQGSKNGTYIKLRAHQGFKLWDGAKILIGHQVLQYHAAEVANVPIAVQREQTRTFAVSSDGASPRGSLTVQSLDGNETREHSLGARTVIGRSDKADVALAGDDFVSPRHALIEFKTKMQGMVIRDMESLNGVYIQIRQPIVLDDGDVFRIGEQLFAVLRSGGSVKPEALPELSE